MIPVVKTLQSTDNKSLGYVLDTVQANVSKVVDKMNKVGLTETSIVSDIDVSTADTVVNTNLGRKIQGWWVIDKNAPVDVYKSSTSNPSSTSTIIVKATGTAKVSFLFF